MFSTLMAAYDRAVQLYAQVLGRTVRYRDARLTFGATVRCDLREYQQRRLYLFGAFEPNLTSLVRHQVRPGDVFADVGANLGYFSMLASTLVGSGGKVIAVEASPPIYNTLRANLDRNGCGNVTPVNVAATADTTTVEILPGAASNTGTTQIRPGSGTVPGRPILDILGADAPRVTFIKVDIEGSERPVLEDILAGSGDLSTRLTIAAEVSPGSADMVAKFAADGFAVFGLPNDYRFSYLLVRRWVGTVELVPLREYDPAFTDYAFIR
jgi:FkbM family methyltransferase